MTRRHGTLSAIQEEGGDAMEELYEDAMIICSSGIDYLAP